MQEHIDAARAAREKYWDESRQHRNWAAIGERLDEAHLRARSFNPRLAYTFGGLALGCALTLVILVVALREPSSPFLPFTIEEPAMSNPRLSTTRPARTHDPRQVTFSDGSTALFTHGALFAMDRGTTRDIRILQHSGKGTYSVVRKEERRFTVLAREVAIAVVGTRFTVEVRQGGAVVVQVSEGSVSVMNGGHSTLLSAGMEWTSDPRSLSLPGPCGDKTNNNNTCTKNTKLLRSLRKSPTVRTLLAQVDVARGAGDTAGAVRLLEQVAVLHGGDPNRTTALFLLAQLRFSLGRYAQAAHAYRQYLSAAPSGTLAMDALAGEARARAKAGQKSRASGLARDYLRRFPGTLHSPDMKELLR
ncbi:tetratricopeptide repeat protein [Myxococcota bacterium]|nr:tetratricopeptide repeat protein [Myxococcota bacterium]MBU1536435.1 tetratricopeptide repeat protein [Myxococcota bacterium]